MNEILDSVEEAIMQTPGPSPHPESDALIRTLEAHYATGDLFAPIKNLPACLGVNFVKAADLTKPTTKAALLAEVELLAPEKLVRLKELAAEHAAAIVEQIKWSPSSALRDFDAQRTGLHQAASDRGADIAVHKFRQREDIQREYHEKVAAIAERMKLIVKDAFPLVKETIIAAENHLKDFLRGREEAERAEAEAYDLEWKPSLIWKAAALNLITARTQIRAFCGRPDQGPVQQLDGWLGINGFNLK
jgi:hypothetical protein